MTAAIHDGPSRPRREPEIGSFYHLQDVDISRARCQGLACFVARHLAATAVPSSATSTEGACASGDFGDSSAPRVYCLGKCYNAPTWGGDNSRPAIHVDASKAIVLERIARGGARSIKSYRAALGYEALSAVLCHPPDRTIAAVEQSGLRGRGGAGFPTGRKWRLAFNEKSTKKYVVTNADEGDPGAYIDRFIMEDDPHCLIEAMAIAAYAIGASSGRIYLRCEYPDAAVSLRIALDEARQNGFLGSNICGTGFRFDIELVMGRGSYICGEETALLNSIEGKRPVAMARPPFATQSGLFGKPTLINNVETLANIPWILRNGSEAYHALGFSSSRGTKVVSLNSLFRNPGLYEIEFGLTVRHIVESLGGGLKTGPLKGLIIGGPLAGVIPPHLLDTPFAFEELRAIGASVGHGGVIAFDEHTTIPELMHHVFSFGAYESCGKCIPCRLGSRRIEQMFAPPGRLPVLAQKTGARSISSDAELPSIIHTLKSASLCGLGTGLAEFAESILRHYPREVQGA